jgi:hypothetical protein
MFFSAPVLSNPISVLSIQKLEHLYKDTVFNVLLSGLPSDGKLLMVTGLSSNIFQALVSISDRSGFRFALSYDKPTYTEGDVFYTANFTGRFEVYPDLPASKPQTSYERLSEKDQVIQFAPMILPKPPIDLNEEEPTAVRSHTSINPIRYDEDDDD